MFYLKHALRFMEWLPEISEKEAYLVGLFSCRNASPVCKDIKDAALSLVPVHGYLKKTVEWERGVWEEWRLRLYYVARRLNVLRNGKWYSLDCSEDRCTSTGTPPDCMCARVMINPGNVISAGRSLSNYLSDVAWSVAGGGSFGDSFRSPARKYASLLMKHRRTRFHIVDIDSEEYSDRVYSLVSDVLGYRPAYLTTSRGIHIIVDLKLLETIGSLDKWVGSLPKDYARLVERYAQSTSIGRIMDLLDYGTSSVSQA